MNKIMIIVLLFFTNSLRLVQAQETINTSGNEAISENGVVSYSIGQLFCKSITGLYTSIIPGVQQPYEISIINDISSPKINLKLAVYPNPTSSFLILKIDKNELLEYKLSVKLYDVNGTLIIKREIKTIETSIDMSNLLPAVYFLEISTRVKNLRTFKIIKN